MSWVSVDKRLPDLKYALCFCSHHTSNRLIGIVEACNQIQYLIFFNNDEITFYKLKTMFYSKLCCIVQCFDHVKHQMEYQQVRISRCPISLCNTCYHLGVNCHFNIQIPLNCMEKNTILPCSYFGFKVTQLYSRIDLYYRIKI